MNWYYELNGEQQGPVSEEQLKTLFAESKIKSDNLVWKQGMADWQSYSSIFGAHSGITKSPLGLQKSTCPTCGATVDPSQLIPAGDRQLCPNCRGKYAQGLREGMANPIQSVERRGTGGMTPNSDIRAIARAALTGNWTTGVLVIFIVSAIDFAIGMVPGGGLIKLFVLGPLNLGMAAVFMCIVRDEHTEVGQLFSGFSRFLTGLGLYFMTGLIIILTAIAAAIPGIVLIVMAYSEYPDYPEQSPLFVPGVFLAIIPAIIAGTYMSLRYAMVYFIANDDPEAGVFEVLKASPRIVDGKKWKLFWLYVSFIGWFILGFLALFIGVLWAVTYFWAAQAAFYDDLGDEA